MPNIPLKALAGLTIVMAAASLTAAARTCEPFAYTSRYLTMRDGVRIAVDLYLPCELPADRRLPTIILQTRYFRKHTVRWPISIFWPGVREPGIAKFVEHGYAYVIVDARGSGASFGTRTQEWSPDEVRDGAEVVDWIIRQPWSDGKVGSTGESYEGAATDFLLSNKHPAVRATRPVGGMFDVYTEIAFPGGVRAEPFVSFWGHVTAEQDSNRFQTTLSGIARYIYKGVPPVQGDSGPAQLEQAIVEHRKNYNLAAVIAKHQFRDETDAVEAMSAYSHRDAIQASGAAISSVTGWYDGALMNSAIKRFLTIRTPGSRLLIGPWSHQGENLSPFATKVDDFDHTAASIQFFDVALKGDTNSLTDEPPVLYYTIGEERWKTAPTWPPPGTTNQTFYFAEGNRLDVTPPTAVGAADRYLVDLTAASGQNTRWNNLTALDVAHFITRDRAERDKKLLVYTGAPLAEDLEVTGHPMITVHLSSDQPDGALFVYLEDGEADGRVHYVTEGVLRIIDRKISPEKAPYKFPMPYRTFAKGDVMPLEPGEIAPIAFDLYPISYLFRKGHRVRVALAGADRDHFAAVSVTAPTWEVHRSAAHPSAIELPVIRR